MASLFHQSAVNIGGSCQDFVQSQYITQKMPPHLKGGVCLGLSAMYMASNADWSIFKNIIATPGGMAHVRGFMNLQSEGLRVGSIAQVSEYNKEVLKLFKVRFTGEETSGATRNVNAMMGACQYVGLYRIGYYGPPGGHAIALHRATGANGRSVNKVFDPNYGEATIPTTMQLERFMGWFFNALYGALNADWYIQRYVFG